MECFTGFKWAVPVAFSEAVSLCRFEEGDILYDNANAYGDDWTKASKAFEHSMIVRYPRRAESGSDSSESGVFASNWSADVRVELYRNQVLVGDGQIETTQGRVYTALWKGDLSVLYPDSDEPELPITLLDVTRNLGETNVMAKKLAAVFPVFVMPRDRSNQISAAKFSKVKGVLQKHLSGEPQILSPKEAGLKDWMRIAPTIEIAFFNSNGITVHQLHELVKSAVYVPSKKSKTDRFRMVAHGVIVSSMLLDDEQN